MRIGFVQFNPIFGQIDKNLDRIEHLIGRRRADLLVLPELCTTGYNFSSLKEAHGLAQKADGPAVKKLIEIARRTGINIVAGFAERSGNRIYNSAVLASADGHLGLYRKTHLFYKEKRWFSPGDTGFKVWTVGRVKVGMMICFDWLFPESARALALMGARIICHPANLVLPFCPDSMPVRALENRVFTVTANRIGRENRGGSNLKFIGQSVIAGPDARVLRRAGETEEGIHTVEIEVSRAGNKKITSMNDIFRDRRPEYYRRLARR